MRAFAELYAALEEAARPAEQVAALARYFADADDADAAWAVSLLLGRKPRTVVPAWKLRPWAAESAGLPAWLFEECYRAVDDVCETAALVFPEPERAAEQPLSRWIEDRLLPLAGENEDVQKDGLARGWRELDAGQRFVWNKLATGGFRSPVSAQQVIDGLSRAWGVDATVLAHRLAGPWQPCAEFGRRLRAADGGDAAVSRPYPFLMPATLEGEPAALGALADWQAEWKWDGMRVQVVRRAGQSFVWSGAGELVTDRFPELAAAAGFLPDGTVLDGEVVPWCDAGVRPFADLQRRLARKTPDRKRLREGPVVLMAFDLPEHAGKDLRGLPLSDRRARLERVVESAGWPFRAAPVVPAGSWDELAARWRESRQRRVEGLVLKRRASPYAAAPESPWRVWRVGPLTVSAVLLYARRGSGRWAAVYSDFTLALWDGDRLVTVARADSGLSEEEVRRVDALVRQDTVERFGPVRTVKPRLVFEVAFEGVQRSPRHKCGVALRQPRLLRWRADKVPAQADTLESLRRMLPREAG
jgi:DNA ligase-1